MEILESIEVKIDEDKFQSFEDVRESGITNMFNLTVVSKLSGLTKEEIIFIMKSYRKLCEKYPNVRNI